VAATNRHVEAQVKAELEAKTRHVLTR
jgi:hypothetical protein